MTKDPLGNDVDPRHPWNKVTLPRPQARDFTDKYSWVVSPRMYDKRNDKYVCCDTGGGPFARQWCTAKAGLVDFGYAKATGESIQMVLPRTASSPEVEMEWKVPEKSNAIERDRARTYHQAYSALIGLHCLERALVEIRAGRTKSWNDFKVPQEAVSVGFHEAARGVLSHHMVIQGGKIANYQPYPPTPWNASVRDVYGTPGPYEDAVQNTPIFEENGPENFKGVDIMRAVRSFDPVPAVRRAHVRRRRQGAQGPAHAHGDVLSSKAARGRDKRKLRRRGGGARAAPGGAGGPGPGADRAPRAPSRSRRRGRAPTSWCPRSSSSTGRAWSASSARSSEEGEAGERLFAAIAGRRAGREPDAHPRPLPRAPGGPRRWRRSRACAPTWSLMAATSSCWR